MLVQNIRLIMCEEVRILEVTDHNVGETYKIKYANYSGGDRAGLFRLYRTFNTENGELNCLTLRLYFNDPYGGVVPEPYVKEIQLPTEYVSEIEIESSYTNRNLEYSVKPNTMWFK